MKWSEVFIVSFLEDYLKKNKSMNYQEIINMANSIVDAIPVGMVSKFDGIRYYHNGCVKKELGLAYKDLVQAYADQGYGEMS